jgi:hypothetical protein
VALSYLQLECLSIKQQSDSVAVADLRKCLHTRWVKEVKYGFYQKSVCDNQDIASVWIGGTNRYQHRL